MSSNTPYDEAKSSEPLSTTLNERLKLRANKSSASGSVPKLALHKLGAPGGALTPRRPAALTARAGLGVGILGGGDASHPASARAAVETTRQAGGFAGSSTLAALSGRSPGHVDVLTSAGHAALPHSAAVRGSSMASGAGDEPLREAPSSASTPSMPTAATAGELQLDDVDSASVRSEDRAPTWWVATQRGKRDLTDSEAAAIPSFLETLQSDPNFSWHHMESGSFLYLVPKRGCMYDLAVVPDPLSVDPQCCITLSSAGITFAMGGTVTFLTVDEYEREWFLYHSIVRMPFFSKYKKWRVFVAWASLVRQRKLKLVRQRIGTELFHMLPAPAACLQQLRKVIVQRIARLELFRVQPGKTYSLREFTELQEETRAAAMRELQAIMDEVRHMVRSTCDVALRRFLEDYGFGHAGDSGLSLAASATAQSSMAASFNLLPAVHSVSAGGFHGHAAVPPSLSSIIARDALSYTEQASLRRRCRLLIRFVRTCDLMIQTALRELIIQAVRRLQLALHPGALRRRWAESHGFAQQYAARATDPDAIPALFKVEVQAEVNPPTEPPAQPAAAGVAGPAGELLDGGLALAGLLETRDELIDSLLSTCVHARARERGEPAGKWLHRLAKPRGRRRRRMLAEREQYESAGLTHPPQTATPLWSLEYDADEELAARLEAAQERAAECSAEQQRLLQRTAEEETAARDGELRTQLRKALRVLGDKIVQQDEPAIAQAVGRPGPASQASQSRVPVSSVHVQVREAALQRTSRELDLVAAQRRDAESGHDLPGLDRKFVDRGMDGQYSTRRLPVAVHEIVQRAQLLEAVRLAGATAAGEAWTGAGLALAPRPMAFHSTMNTLMGTLVRAVAAAAQPLLAEGEFQPYVAATAGDEELAAELEEARQSTLEALVSSDAAYQRLHTAVLSQVNAMFNTASSCAAAMQPFRSTALLALRQLQYLSDGPSSLDGIAVTTVKRVLAVHDEQVARLRAMPTAVHAGAVLVDAHRLQETLVACPERCISLIMSHVPAVAAMRNTELLAVLSSYYARLNHLPSGVKEYVELLEALGEANQHQEVWREEEEYLRDLYALALERGQEVGDRERSAHVMLLKTSSKLRARVLEVDAGSNSATAKHAREVDDAVPRLHAFVNTARAQADEDAVHEFGSDAYEVVQHLTEVSAEVAHLGDEAREYVRYQRALRLPAVSFESLHALTSEVALKLRLWQAVKEWREQREKWLMYTLDMMDLPLMTASVGKLLAAVLSVERNMPQGAPVLTVCQAARGELLEFRSVLPVLQDLKSPALQDRHWGEVRELLGYDPRGITQSQASRARTGTTRAATSQSRMSGTADGQDQATAAPSLTDMLAGGLASCAPDITRIAAEAAQERVLRDMLQKVAAEWQAREMEIVPSKFARDAFILAGAEALQTALDESFVALNTIVSSRYVGALRSEVAELQTQLSGLQDVLDAWADVQKQWMALFSIFHAPDIQRQLPTESKAFAQVDSSFREITRRARDDPVALRVGNRSQLKELLRKHAGTLDMVQHGLDAYLEAKRRAFPRFYFLADSDLLFILSQAPTNPRSVVPHLLKMFDAVASLGFRGGASDAAGSMSIEHMASPEGERMDLGKNLKARGGPEEWLGAVSQRMQHTVSTGIARALESMPTRDTPPQAAVRAAEEAAEALAAAARANKRGSEKSRARMARRMSLAAPVRSRNLGIASPKAKAAAAPAPLLAFMQQLAEARAEWALDRGLPAQAVAAACQIGFTAGSEAAFAAAAATGPSSHARIAGVPDMELPLELLAGGPSAAAQASGSHDITVDASEPRHALALWRMEVLCFLEALVKWARRELLPVQRRLVVALLTTEVHNRDIVARLIDERVQEPSAFVWRSQLRLYWRAGQGEVAAHAEAQQADAALAYGNEYQGATSRLVITPLTDRCWLTITSAWRLCLGANPAGPAGTGKTESSKDLAKSLGIFTLVVNMSEQVNYAMMAKLLSGLAQSGAWAVLDEFNRIDVEVLSVTAQLILQLRNARLAGLTHAEFEGSTLPILPHHVIVTMNPGYAGRTELPDNLKVLFRPVAMMVPDYALIAEVILYAEGFTGATSLSRKMTRLYKLASEQLSQQPIYDFGMRALKAVLVIAGSLKRSSLDLSEEAVLIQAMRDANVPKLLEEDLPLFNAIVSDLFPGVQLPSTEHSDLLAALQVQAIEDGLQPTPVFLSKVQQLKDTMAVRFGTAMVGGLAGKSAARGLLARATTRLNAARAGFPQVSLQVEAAEDVLQVGGGSSGRRRSVVRGSGRPHGAEAAEEAPGARQPKKRWPYSVVRVRELNPKAITMGELFGRYDEMTQGWSDGVAAAIMRQAVRADDKDVHWAVFDGPVDALWIENMNTVLDDNMTLCLANGERVKLTPKLRLLFEVGDLAAASPATVSRLGIVHLEQEDLGWQSVVQSWLSSPVMQVLVANASARHHLWHTLAAVLPEALRLAAELATDVRPAPVVAVQSTCSLLQAQLTLMQRHGVSINPKAGQVVLKALDRVLVWAIVWGIGGSLASDTWRAFDNGVREVLRKTGVELAGLATGASLYDFFVDWQGSSVGHIRPWRELVPAYRHNPAVPPHAVIVPTVDTSRYSALIRLSALLHDRYSPMALFERSHQLAAMFTDAHGRHLSAGAGETGAAAAAAAHGSGGSGNGGGGGAEADDDDLRQKPSAETWQSTHAWWLPWELRARALLSEQSTLASQAEFAAGGVPRVPGLREVGAFDWGALRDSTYCGPYGVLDPVEPAPRRGVFVMGATGAGKSVVVSQLLAVTALEEDELAPGSSLRAASAAASVIARGTVAVSRATTHLSSAGDEGMDEEDAVGIADRVSVCSSDSESAASAVRPAAVAAVPVHAATADSGSRPAGSQSEEAAAFLRAGMQDAAYLASHAVNVTLSGASRAADVQDAVEARLQRKRKGRLGAPPGSRAVVFVDDVNMPSKEVYGAQPPIELLRQWCDCGGWYDRGALHWTHLEDSVLVAAGGLPGGGRSHLSPRFMRHLSLLCMPQPSPDSLMAMFEPILSGALGAGGFASDVRALAGPVVTSTVQVYQRCCMELLPTPTKSHYLFNLRDVARVVHSMMRAHPSAVQDGNTLVRLWLHESQRVFSDRLVAESDKEWFSQLLVQQLHRNFHLSWEHDKLFGAGATLEAARRRGAERAAAAGPAAKQPGAPVIRSSQGGEGPLVFASWLRMGEEHPQYEDCGLPDQLPSLLRAYAEEHNRASPVPLHLVFFEDAIMHVVRIARILSAPASSALLVGVSGSGKRALARMAAFITNVALKAVDSSAGYSRDTFREDMKEVLLTVGVERRPTAVLLSESDLQDSAILEDVNCLLNSGEIPGLWTSEERTSIVARMREAIAKDSAQAAAAATPEAGPGLAGERPASRAMSEAADGASPFDAGVGAAEALDALAAEEELQQLGMSPGLGVGAAPMPASRAECEDTFSSNVRELLHIVLSLSPEGPALRARLRAFPSLLSCCTLDWFMPWPEDALHSVAQQVLHDMVLPGEQEMRRAAELRRALRNASAAAVAERQEYLDAKAVKGGESQSVTVATVEDHAMWQPVLRVMAKLYMAAERQAQQHAESTGRVVHITPRLYLDSLSMLKSILGKQYDQRKRRIARMRQGVRRLRETVATVTQLQAELKELAPELKRKAEEVSELLKVAHVEREKAAAQASEVEVEEAAVRAQAEAVEALQLEAQAELDEALPALQAAERALSGLDRNDIVEMRSFIQPPEGVRVVMEAVCLLLGEGQDWDTGKRVLSKPDFLRTLRVFDRDAMPDSVLKELGKFTSHPLMSVATMSKISKAATSLCLWVHAMEKYGHIYRQVQPRRARVAELTAELDATNASLRVKQAELATAMEALKSLETQVQQTREEREALVSQEELAKARLGRAEKLLSGMQAEGERWRASVVEMEAGLETLLGDVLLASAAIVYAGPFTGEARAELYHAWRQAAKAARVPLSEPWSLASVMTDEVTVQDWRVRGLPADDFSTDNAVLVTNSKRVSLLIDPQGQGSAWLRSLAGSKLETFNVAAAEGEAMAAAVADAAQGAAAAGAAAAAGPGAVVSGQPSSTSRRARGRSLAQLLEACVRHGRMLLVEDVHENLPPELEPVLSNAIHMVPGTGAKGAPPEWEIRLGDVSVPYDPAFELYITTSLGNPAFSPSTAMRVNIVNFQVTTAGLEEQLLARAMALEQPDLETQRSRLVTDIAADQRSLRELESKVLNQIADAKGNILDNQVLIDTLAAAKTTSTAVAERVLHAKETEARINESREWYRALAARGALLYSAVTSLASIDPMYVYSLEYFVQLFERCLRDPAVPAVRQVRSSAARRVDSDDEDSLGSRATLVLPTFTDELVDAIRVRVGSLADHMLGMVYMAVQRGLFAKDKSVFSLALSLQLLQAGRSTQPAECALLLKGAGVGAGALHWPPNPLPPAVATRARAGRAEDSNAAVDAPVPNGSWHLLCQAGDQVPAMEELPEAMSSNWPAWAEWRRGSAPATTAMPGDWNSRLNRVQQLLVLRALAPAHVAAGAAELVSNTLGNELLAGRAATLAEVFEDMNCKLPCVFVLSQGADPTDEVLSFAKASGTSARLKVISLGQGQGPKAEAMLNMAMAEGMWLLLSNCHLAQSWMPRLSTMLTALRRGLGGMKVHPRFRLFMTSFPTPAFPVSILRNAVKVTNEPPRGVRAALQRALDTVLAEPQLVVFDQVPRGMVAPIDTGSQSPLSAAVPGSPSMASLAGRGRPSIQLGAPPLSPRTVAQTVDEDDASDMSSVVSGMTGSSDVARAAEAAKDQGASNGASVLWRRMGFALAFFHALVTERRRFGALGWNVSYEFSEADLSTALAVVRDMIQDAAVASMDARGIDLSAVPGFALGSVHQASSHSLQVDAAEEASASAAHAVWSAIQLSHADSMILPWDALGFMVGDIVYGGRVTDSWDRRCLRAMLAQCFSEEVIEGDDCPMLVPDEAMLNLSDVAGIDDEVPSYSVPLDTSYSGLQAAVARWPGRAPPAVFGLSENAAAAARVNEGTYLLDTLLRMGAVNITVPALELPASPAARTASPPGSPAAASTAGGAEFMDEAELSAAVDPGSRELLRLLFEVNSARPAPLDEERVQSLIEAAHEVAKRDALKAARKRARSRRGRSQGPPRSASEQEADVEDLPPPPLLMVLRQEVQRLNALLLTVQASCTQLRKALLGVTTMSAELDAVADALQMNAVPQQWLQAGYASQRALGSWLKDLAARVSFFEGWIKRGKVSEYWLGAFTFPQGFLTAVLQRHARKTGVAVNDLDLAAVVCGPTDGGRGAPPARPGRALREAGSTASLPSDGEPESKDGKEGEDDAGEGKTRPESAEDIAPLPAMPRFPAPPARRRGGPPAGGRGGALRVMTGAPGTGVDGASPPSTDQAPEIDVADGVCVTGLWLEAMRWSHVQGGLCDARPGEMFAPLPSVHLVPVANHTAPLGAYECPVYKTLARAGQLSTTGISTNFVLAVHLPTEVEPDVLIKRGAAIVLDPMIDV